MNDEDRKVAELVDKRLDNFKKEFEDHEIAESDQRLDGLIQDKGKKKKK